MGENTPKIARYLHQQCFGHILKKKKTKKKNSGHEEELKDKDI